MKQKNLENFGAWAAEYIMRVGIEFMLEEEIHPTVLDLEKIVEAMKLRLNGSLSDEASYWKLAMSLDRFGEIMEILTTILTDIGRESVKDVMFNRPAIYS